MAIGNNVLSLVSIGFTDCLIIAIYLFVCEIEGVLLMEKKIVLPREGGEYRHPLYVSHAIHFQVFIYICSFTTHVHVTFWAPQINNTILFYCDMLKRHKTCGWFLPQ